MGNRRKPNQTVATPAGTIMTRIVWRILQSTEYSFIGIYPSYFLTHRILLA
jgi:hypothetical protein